MTTITAIKYGKEQTGSSALVGIALAQFVLTLDSTIVYLASPSMAKALGPNPALSQWIVLSYGLMFGGFLILGGRLCDRFGASGVFTVAVCLFSVASLLAGLALNGEWLIVARGAQGIGAALMQPVLLAMIARYFPCGSARAKALSIWGAVSAMGAVAGVLLGGIFPLVAWRWVFLMYVPILMLCLWLLKRTMVPGMMPAPPIPILAALSGSFAIITLVLWLTSLTQAGTDDIQTHDWARTAAIGALIFFIGEKFSKRPLVSQALRRLPGLRIACWTSACYTASAGAEFFLLTLLLQNGYGHNALQTSLCLMLLVGMIIIGNMLAGKLMAKITAEKTLFCGFALMAFALWLLADSLDSGAFHWRFTVALLFSGLGNGMIYAANFTVGLKALPREMQGTGSGLMVTAQYVGGNIAISLLVIVLSYYPGGTGYYYACSLLVFFASLGAVAALMAEELPSSLG